MHPLHRYSIDEEWPDGGLIDPGLRERMEIRRHRTCGDCGRGQCEIMDAGDSRDPMWGWAWLDDRRVIERIPQH